MKVSRNESLFDALLAKYISAATIRAHQLDIALNAITVSNEVMGGAPVFKGTRVLVETVLGSLEEGSSLALLKDSYPFLTEDIVKAAEIYTQTRQPPDPNRRLSELHPDWTLKSITIIYPEKNDLAPFHR